ncbi:MAG: thioredoxin family protein [Planctomycetota bacterium]
MIEQIDGGAFDERVRKSSQPVVVDFFGQACPPCKKLLPILEDVATDNAGRATFLKVDVADAEDVAAELGVYTVPTVVLFKGGQPVDKITGYVAKPTLAARVAELLGG